MKIVIAKNAGYCFGVRDAVDLAYDISNSEGNVYMLGDIVHNEQVVNDLPGNGSQHRYRIEEAYTNRSQTKMPQGSAYGSVAGIRSSIPVAFSNIARSGPRKVRVQASSVSQKALSADSALRIQSICSPDGC